MGNVFSIQDPMSSAKARRASRYWLLLLLLGGCVAKPPVQGRTVFLASGADLQSINPLVAVHPLARQVQAHVLFLTLASYDSAFRPVPRLASWEWDAERTGLTFRVRRGVRWHDGTPTTADDVVWTLDMARRREVAFPRARDLSTVSAVERRDSFTVHVSFSRPQPRFPDVLTDLAILPHHRFAGLSPGEIRSAPFNLHPVGNGPFEFIEYRPNQRWVFRRFEAFPKELHPPRIDRFVVVVVDEAATKLAALTSGELDFAGVNPAHASFVRADPRLDVMDYPVQFAYALVWNLRREPFNDVRLRRALTVGLDRELMVRAYLYGFGTAAEGPVSPDHPWFEPPDPVAYDSEAAARTLDELGWRRGDDGIRERGGQRLEFGLLTVGTADNALEQMIQAQLRDLGVMVHIRQHELVTFLAVAQGPGRDFDALVTGIPGNLSLGHVAAMFDGESPGPLAYPGYASAAFDAAIRRTREAATEADLAAAWHEAQRVLARDLPTTWLYHARGVQGVSRRVRGVRLDLRGELAGLADWWIAEEESNR
jgi:peptide/nickel transport system substrate-binding protein